MTELWCIETDEQQDDISEILRHRLDYDWRQFEQEYGTDSPQFKGLLTRQKSELAQHRQQTIMGYNENAMDLALYNAELIT